MVECHASDLVARVQFPLPAPKCVFVELLAIIDTSKFEENKSEYHITYISRFSRLYFFCFFLFLNDLSTKEKIITKLRNKYWKNN